jgi:hypothetical protein
MNLNYSTISTTKQSVTYELIDEGRIIFLFDCFVKIYIVTTVEEYLGKIMLEKLLVTIVNHNLVNLRNTVHTIGCTEYTVQFNKLRF